MDSFRDRARDIANAVSQGQDVREPTALHKFTLRDGLALVEATLDAKARAESTKTMYREYLERYMGDLLDRRLISFTAAEIGDRHRKIGNGEIINPESGEKLGGKYVANGTMRVFRAVWNRSRKRFGRPPELSEGIMDDVDWYPEKARRIDSLADNLPQWRKEIDALPNPICGTTCCSWRSLACAAGRPTASALKIST